MFLRPKRSRKAGENSIVYTIGFELTGTEGEAAAAVLEECATSASTSYRVDGVEIA